MAIYAIGDIQGCFLSFQALLKKIDFHPSRDRLWLAGDLVNRGPDSYDVLRWIYDHQDSVRVVLGNHDLYFLSRVLIDAPIKKWDTLSRFFENKDTHLMVEWLRRQPFLVEEDPWIMVHAGFHPSWTLEEARKLAAAATEEINGPQGVKFLKLFQAAYDPQWDEKASPEEKKILAAKIMTRIRACRASGELNHRFTDGLEKLPKNQFPWFRHPERKTLSKTILFGHWSSLGFYDASDAICLDSGCVRGRSLTALRLEDRKVFQQPSLEKGGTYSS